MNNMLSPFWEEINRACFGLHTSIEEAISTAILNGAADYNHGTCAGKYSGAFNLGDPNNEITIFPSNVLDVLCDIRTVMEEVATPEHPSFVIENLFCVCPHWTASMIEKTDYEKINDSFFRLFFSTHNPVRYDGGKLISHIVFGHKDSVIVETPVNLHNPRVKILRPDLLGYACCMKGR